jgi:phosphoribosylformylglycinamidine synthase
MLGIIDEVAHITTQNFKQEGDIILLAGKNRDELGGSEYLKEIHGLATGDAPAIDLPFERNLQLFILAAIRAGLVRSAHDVSEGGLVVALAECCFGDPDHPIGAKIGLTDEIRRDALYFGETQSRVILSIDPTRKITLDKLARERNVPLAAIGFVAGDSLIVNEDIRIPVTELAGLYYEAVGKAMA